MLPAHVAPDHSGHDSHRQQCIVEDARPPGPSSSRPPVGRYRPGRRHGRLSGSTPLQRASALSFPLMLGCCWSMTGYPASFIKSAAPRFPVKRGTVRRSLKAHGYIGRSAELPVPSCSAAYRPVPPRDRQLGVSRGRRHPASAGRFTGVSRNGSRRRRDPEVRPGTDPAPGPW